MIRMVDATFAQHIANVELNEDQAGIVQWVLSHTPTIDAELVIHGRWEIVDFAGNMRCSACGQIMDTDYNYCPNCGAKMDGEAK